MIRGIIFDLYHTLTGLESRWSQHPPTSALLGIERSRWEQALHEHSRWRLCGEERDSQAIVRRLAHGIDVAALAGPVPYRRSVNTRVPLFGGAQ